MFPDELGAQTKAEAIATKAGLVPTTKQPVKSQQKLVKFLPTQSPKPSPALLAPSSLQSPG
jgi:hypothetical protein